MWVRMTRSPQTGTVLIHWLGLSAQPLTPKRTCPLSLPGPGCAIRFLVVHRESATENGANVVCLSLRIDPCVCLIFSLNMRTPCPCPCAKKNRSVFSSYSQKEYCSGRTRSRCHIQVIHVSLSCARRCENRQNPVAELHIYNGIWYKKEGEKKSV